MAWKNVVTLALLGAFTVQTVGILPDAQVLAQSVGVASSEEGQRNLLKGAATKVENPPVWEDAPLPKPGRIFRPANASVRRGDVLAEQYKLKAAEEKYLQALQQNPQDAGAHNGLGKVYYQMTTSSNQSIRDDMDGLYQKATFEFLTALRYQPNYLEARLNLGTMYMEQGRLRDAEEEFRRAHRLAPENPKVYEKLGTVLLKQNRVTQAIPHLEQAVMFQSGNATAHYYLGKAYAARGHYDKALKELQTSLYLYPNSAPVHHQMGEVYALQGNEGAAVTEFKKSMWIKPEYIPAHLSLAKFYEDRGDDAHALETLQNLLGSYPPYKYPEFQSIQLNAADLARKAHQLELATKLYQDVLQESPDNASAKAGLSKAEVQMAKRMAGEGDLVGRGEAVRMLEAALESQPGNLKARLDQIKLAGGPRSPEALEPGFVSAVMKEPTMLASASVNKGELLQVRHEFLPAEREYETALHAVTTPEDTLVLGEIFLELGHPAMAERTFEKALTYSPRHAGAKMGLKEVHKAQSQARLLLSDARLHAKNRYYERAVSILDESMQLDRYNPETYQLMGNYQEQLKNYPKALEAYRSYLHLAPPEAGTKSIRDRVKRLERRLNS
jgi:tetratricopeptide (TPR) repeat protein